MARTTFGFDPSFDCRHYGLPTYSTFERGKRAGHRARAWIAARWGIRIWPDQRRRDRGLFDVAIDSKLRLQSRDGSPPRHRCRRPHSGSSDRGIVKDEMAHAMRAGRTCPLDHARSSPRPRLRVYLLVRTSFIVLPVQRRIARRRFALSLKPTFQATSSTLMRVVCKYSIASLRRTSSTITP